MKAARRYPPYPFSHPISSLSIFFGGRLGPKSTVYPCMQGRRAGALACMRRGARAGAECGQHAQPWGAGFWAAGARALGAGAGFWPACACLHSRGGRRGSAQAAERTARAGTERLACGRKAQASTGFGLHAHDCARVFCVGVQDAVGCRASASARRLRHATAIRPVLPCVIVQYLSR